MEIGAWDHWFFGPEGAFWREGRILARTANFGERGEFWREEGDGEAPGTDGEAPGTDGEAPGTDAGAPGTAAGGLGRCHRARPAILNPPEPMTLGRPAGEIEPDDQVTGRCHGNSAG